MWKIKADFQGQTRSQIRDDGSVRYFLMTRDILWHQICKYVSENTPDKSWNENYFMSIKEMGMTVRIFFGNENVNND